MFRNLTFMKLLTLTFILFFYGCGDSSSIKTVNPYDIKKGKILYITRCESCHSISSVGPELINTSVLVLEEKTLRGVYPKDYVPKVKTNLMQPFLDLNKNDILQIYSYLNSEEYSK